MLKRTQSPTVRRAKAAPHFITLLLEDPLLLRTIFEFEKLHADGPIGAAIEAIFHAYGKDVDLIKLALCKAVERTHGPEQIFREDSIFTDITSRFMKSYGGRYLQKVLKHTLEIIVQHTKSGDEYAIDSAVVDVAAIDRTLSASKDIVHSVVAKTDLLPPEIRLALTAFMNATEAKFGTPKGDFAIVGLFWLRFICPAIVDPVHAGILKRSNSVTTAARSLLAVSKTVKALAGGQLPDNIHPVAATALRDVSTKWQPKIDACFQELRQPFTAPIAPRKPESKAAFMPAMSALHMIQKRRAEFEAALVSHDGEATLRALTPILESLLLPQSPRKSTLLKPVLGSGERKSTSLVENWSTEKIVAWLDCIDLGHHKAAFSRKQINGAALLTLDTAELLELGMEQEEERWLLLQSVRDLSSLHERFECVQERRRSRTDSFAVVPMLRGLPDDSMDDSSGSSTPSSGRSPWDSTSANAPLSANSSSEDSQRRGSVDALLECVFMVSSPRRSVKPVKGKRTDSLATLQANVEKEIRILGMLTYTDASTQRLVKLSTEDSFQHFLSTAGKVDSTDLSTAVYHIVILPSV